MFRLGLIVLAAGESSRMGKPKQLLPFGKTTLLRHAVLTATQTALYPIITVLGAHSEACREQIRDLPVHIVTNRNWEMGMGSSIGFGIETLLRIAPRSYGVLLMLHDQPLITNERLAKLVALKRSSHALIVSSSYEGTVGVPAIFDRKLFVALQGLRGVEGAKKVLNAHASKVLTVPTPEAAWDIDTPEEYQTLVASIDAL